MCVIGGWEEGRVRKNGPEVRRCCQPLTASGKSGRQLLTDSGPKAMSSVAMLGHRHTSTVLMSRRRARYFVYF